MALQLAKSALTIKESTEAIRYVWIGEDADSAVAPEMLLYLRAAESTRELCPSDAHITAMHTTHTIVQIRRVFDCSDWEFYQSMHPIG